MKTIFLPLTLLVATSLMSFDELSWVDEQVQAIKPPRVGLTSRELSHVKNPFIFLKKNRDEKEKTKEKKIKSSSQKSIQTKDRSIPKKTKHVTRILSLEAIINKSVLISGEWYKVGDSINGFTVKEISGNSVLLTKRSKELLLTTKSRSKKIKFQK